MHRSRTRTALAASYDPTDSIQIDLARPLEGGSHDGRRPATSHLSRMPTEGHRISTAAARRVLSRLPLQVLGNAASQDSFPPYVERGLKTRPANPTKSMVESTDLAA